MAGRKRSKKERLSIYKQVSPGASPGTHVPDPEAPTTARICVMQYGPEALTEEEVPSAAAAVALVGKAPVTWIDVDGVGDARLVEELGRGLGLHPLALEDAMSLYQRPKVEEYPGNLFIVVRMAHPEGRLNTEQLSIFLGENFVVTFQGDHPGDCLDPVRRRIRQTHGRIRGAGTDYLTYALVDAVIDHYFPVLDAFGQDLEHLEDELILEPLRSAPERIQRAKQDLQLLRRVLMPLRDAMNGLSHTESTLVRPETRIFLRDCYDHTGQLIDVANTYRELAGGLMDLYLSGVSNKMNEVMKFLTLVSSIFIPLTFIVGVYGMNFDTRVSRWNMPELEWAYGYPAVMAAMVLVGLGQYVFFRGRGWLQTPP
jgi:magnesium transporter